MKKPYNRRNFIQTTTKGVAAAGLITASSYTGGGRESLEDSFIHHVFFWLKQPVTQEMKTKFEAELKKLITVETIVDYHLGVPAPTGRDVIDTTYSYSPCSQYSGTRLTRIFIKPIPPTSSSSKFVRNSGNGW